MLDVDEGGTTVSLQSILDHGARLEALVSGLDNSRVLVAAAQLAGFPLLDERGPGPDSTE